MNTALSSYQWVLMALCLWREARGCSHNEKVAIAHVICNRALHEGPEFPKTLVGVITQPIQFTSISPPQARFLTQDEVYNATKWPEEGDANFAECCAIADSFGSATEPEDPTMGATNYYSEPIPRIPLWADPAKLTVKIGVFHFYKL
jgi:spore germination cell wall hydrolase CwlJ-like protein